MSLIERFADRRLFVLTVMLLLAAPFAGATTACFGCPGATVIYDGFNRDGVSNNPTGLPIFTITAPTYIVQILNYHYNGGLGADPTGATISIVNNSSNATVFQGAAQAVPIGNTNTHWAAFPNMFLTPGTYRIEDSGRATWSYSTTNFFTLPGDGVNWAPGVGFSAVFGTPEPSVFGMLALGSGLIALRLLRRAK